MDLEIISSNLVDFIIAEIKRYEIPVSLIQDIMDDPDIFTHKARVEHVKALRSKAGLTEDDIRKINDAYETIFLYGGEVTTPLHWGKRSKLGLREALDIVQATAMVCIKPSAKEALRKSLNFLE